MSQNCPKIVLRCFVNLAPDLHIQHHYNTTTLLVHCDTATPLQRPSLFQHIASLITIQA